MTDPHCDVQAVVGDAYHIDRALGSGGMATVYLAEDVRHRRKVAIKLLFAATSPDARMRCSGGHGSPIRERRQLVSLLRAREARILIYRSGNRWFADPRPHPAAR